VRQFILEHQGEKIATDRAGARQTVVLPQHDFGRESEYFPVNWGTDHSRHVVVFGDKSTGYDNVRTRLCATLGNPLASSVDLATPHERDCSAISARASRARRLRCLRNKVPSLDSLFRLRSLSAYWRSAVRTSAVRFLRLDEVSVSSSRSLEVASSIAIVFMHRSISASLHGAQAFRFVALARASRVIK